MAIVLNPVLMYAVQNYITGRPGQGLSLSNGFFVNPIKQTVNQSSTNNDNNFECPGVHIILGNGL